MTPVRAVSADEIRLGDVSFWLRPQAEREGDRLQSMFIHGIQHMPCELTPGGAG